jgi:hypothetical protein
VFVVIAVSQLYSQALAHIHHHPALSYLPSCICSWATLSRVAPRLAIMKRHYSALSQPTLAMSELICKTLDHDATDMLIDKWLEHRNDAYWEWFQGVRERKHAANSLRRQVLVWNKGEFLPENIFCRTVDTGRLIPLDRTWSTHVYHHRSMQDRKLSMMPVVFTMVSTRADQILIIVIEDTFSFLS